MNFELSTGWLCFRPYILIILSSLAGSRCLYICSLAGELGFVSLVAVVGPGVRPILDGVVHSWGSSEDNAIASKSLAIVVHGSTIDLNFMLQISKLGRKKDSEKNKKQLERSVHLARLLLYFSLSRMC